MNQAEVIVNNQTYRIGKMNALTQFHVTRRLGPVLAAVGISLQAIASGIKNAEGGLNADFSAALGPATEIMARMTDEDANYIIFTCLNVVSRKDGDRFAPVTTGGNLITYQDIDMPGMLRLVIAVLQDNLANFMQGLLAEPSSNEA